MPSPLWLVIGCPLEWCAAHTKCPPGKYTKKAGTAVAQPECETCPDGFFKDHASKSSISTDSCTIHYECPPGEYALAGGSVIKQPTCEMCAPGLFKDVASSSSTDGCIAPAKCPPGKFASTLVSVTTGEPKCTECPSGFFTSVMSKSKKVFWVLGKMGQRCRDVCRQAGGSCAGKHWPKSLAEFQEILQDIGTSACYSIEDGSYWANPVRESTGKCYWKGRDEYDRDRCLESGTSREMFCPCSNVAGKYLGMVELRICCLLWWGGSLIGRAEPKRKFARHAFQMCAFFDRSI